MCIKYEASGDKDMHKSGWAIPPKPYNPDKDKDKPEKVESTEEGEESWRKLYYY